MLLYFIILTIMLIGIMGFSHKRSVIHLCGILYFVVQGGLLGWIVIGGNWGGEQSGVFVYDSLGVSYGVLISVVGGLVGWRSVGYLDNENLKHVRLYFISLVVLSFCLLGVFLSNNAAVSWIFLEATTLAAAGLIYHRRTVRALEATWKYIFVSSVGIAVAYLGILLLSTTGVESLNYNELSDVVASSDTANPLYMKIAFLFILLGYSTKLEVFPLFTVGVDANHSSPAPASAFLSSGMVGGGFVAIYRVYKMFEGSEIFGWIMNLLILTAFVSLVFAAVYMGRTGNFKRLLAYSTVEHSGLVLLGLGLGGVGVFAALLHSMAHMIIKAVVFLQISVVGRVYRSYKIGRIGGYIGVDRIGAVVIMLGVMGLVAAPPSVLFVSEFLIFNDIIDSTRWWMMIIILVPLLACAYWMMTKMMWIIFAPQQKQPIESEMMQIERRGFSVFSLVLVLMMMGIMVVGVVEFEGIQKLLESMM